MREEKHNPWSLYSSLAGWQVVGQRLTEALNTMLIGMDIAVNSGKSIPISASAAFIAMQDVLDDPGNSEYGASDTEGRDHLAASIQWHLRNRYCLRGATVNRWGGVNV